MSNIESQILSQLNEIKSEIDSLKTTINRMDNHITFVEGVYEVVKSPFHLLMNIVNRTFATIKNEDGSESLKELTIE